MALNIQSGQTWAEIRAELNNKVLDKNGDEMSGTLGIDDVILDAKGQNAIETDNETQRIKLYGKYVGEPLYSQASVTFDVSKGIDEYVHSIELPSSMYNRGMCFITFTRGNIINDEGYINTTTTRKMVCWFSRDLDGCIGFRSLSNSSGNEISFIYNTGEKTNGIQKIYIEDNFIKIAVHNISNHTYRITIDAWEVW